MLHNRAGVLNESSEYGEDIDIEMVEKRGVAGDSIEQLIAADVNRNALPQLTDCWVNDGKWLAAYHIFKSIVYLFTALRALQMFTNDFVPCNVLEVGQTSICRNSVPCEVSSTKAECSKCLNSQPMCMLHAAGDTPSITCFDEDAFLSECTEPQACIPSLVFDIRKSLLYLGTIALMQAILEFIGGWSTCAFSSLYHGDFESMSRGQRAQVFAMKLIPYLTTVAHMFALASIVFGWNMLNELSKGCPGLREVDGTLFVESFRLMCTLCLSGWLTFLLCGYHVRKNYKVSGDLYFPVTEPNPVLCCFDLECTSRAAQEEPRCCMGVYMCSQQTFPERGCEVCGFNKIPKMVRKFGEVVFGGYRILGQVALKYLREIHHVGP